jgi:hypothetical protein
LQSRHHQTGPFVIWFGPYDSLHSLYFLFIIKIVPNFEQVGIARHQIAIGVSPLIILASILSIFGLFFPLRVHYKQIVDNNISSRATAPCAAFPI